MKLFSKYFKAGARIDIALKMVSPANAKVL
jgi:hypothetical protein